MAQDFSLPTPQSHQLPSRGIDAYLRVYEAEVEAILSRHKENLVFAWVIGFLLLELFNARNGILGNEAYESIVKDVLSPPLDLNHSCHQVVFTLGKLYRDHLIRCCTFIVPSIGFVLYLSFRPFKSGRAQSRILNHPFIRPALHTMI